MVAENYASFLERKSQIDGYHGFEPTFLPSVLMELQTALTSWAIQKGRSAIFGDCGIGKTLMQLVWAQNILEHTNKPVLIVTPLSVTAQTLREAEKFGIAALRIRGGEVPAPGIHVTNYERLHLLDPANFAGMVLDESSILKSFDGSRKQQITEFMRKMKFRLLCTATPAPNDHIELGTSSEALGYLGHVEVLAKFFKNDQNTGAVGSNRYCGKSIKWRFKGHAEEPFWRWVCSWSRAARRPSDLGFDDGALVLPELREREHVVDGGGDLKPQALDIRQWREECRRTLAARCELAAALASQHRDPFISWCHLNDEGDLLEEMLPDAVQVSGSDSDEEKEEKILAFLDGEARGLITKTKIGAWGLNFQHCGHHTYFPDHSYEQYYQCVRRSHRFGRKDPVQVDMVTSSGARGVLENLQRKAKAADHMFERLVAHMRNELSIERSNPYTKAVEVPAWL